MDVAEIAGDLLDRERTSLLRAEQEGSLGKWFMRPHHADGPSMRSLRRRELGTPVWCGLMLTALGLAVRAHLLNQDTDHD
ncbi:hypothetical protein CA235_07255 [Sphingomonas sp. ABOLF]|uniref:hypothetical protein n=1 Tax=Sphingomonas sp. ABOLF TaxID=1985879 RepID=UPI0010035F70|nr:hypothetical protein [Sphingomonas sp. ABOLF]RSV15643.1 hypothetical protein CA235_07255 [Sphingomonas sp. ABOLF]